MLPVLVSTTLHQIDPGLGAFQEMITAHCHRRQVQETAPQVASTRRPWMCVSSEVPFK